MKTSVIRLLMPIALLGILFSACKKKGARIIVDPPFSGCLITRMTDGNHVISLFYLDNGRVDSTYEIGGNFPVEKKFSWSSDHVIVRYTSNGNYYAYDSISFNKAGYVTNYRSYFSPPHYDNTAYTYNGNNEVQSFTTVGSSGGPAMTGVYAFSGGNLAHYTLAGNTATTSFDYSREAKTGDFFSYQSLTRYGGLRIFNNANLFTGFISAGGSIPVGYEFQGDGKISQITFTEGGTQHRFDYTYTCR